MKDCENRDCKKCSINIGITIVGTIATIYLVYIFAMLFFTSRNIDRNLNIGFSLGDSFWGAIAGGTITLLVMYFTNKVGRENVERTIEKSEELQQTEIELSIKNYVRQLILLWKQQKYEVELSYKVWEEDEKILDTNFTTLDLDKILNILGNIPSIDEKHGTAIIDFNSNLLLLNEKRKEYSEILDIFAIDANQNKFLHDKRYALKKEYEYVLGEVNKQIEKVNNVVDVLKAAY